MRSIKFLIVATAACWALATGSAFANDAAGSNQPVKDAYITTKVKAELAKDKSTEATDINVDTKNGVVILRGTVDSAAEKQKAEQDARAVKGVTDVKNELAVK